MMYDIERRECCFRTTPSQLERLVWELTFSCTMDCFYCFQARTKHKREDLELEQLVHRKVLEALPELGVKDILLTGGEPLFLRQRLFDIIDALDHLKISYSISTIGFPRELFRDVVARRPRAINLSIDPPASPSGGTLGPKERIKNLVELLDIVNEFKIPVKLTGLITIESISLPDYFKEIREVIKHYSFIESIYVTNPYHIGYQRPDLSLSSERVEDFLNEIQTLGDGLKKARIVNFSASSLPLNNCPAGQSIFSIVPNGDVVACPFLYQISQSFACANILRDDPVRIKGRLSLIHDTIENKMKQLISETGECKKCSEADKCGGGCYAETFTFEEVASPQLICRRTAKSFFGRAQRFKTKPVGSPTSIVDTQTSIAKCNSVIHQQTIRAIHDYVNKNMSKLYSIDLAHNFDHIYEVVKLAQYIGRKEGANLRIVIPAAYFHDFYPKHPHHFHLHTDESIRHARAFLANLGFSDEEIALIVHCIITSSYNAFTLGISPQILEAQVLRDADFLDSMGARGIARTMAFSGKYATAIGEYNGNPEKPRFRSPALTGIDRTAFSHFDTKLLKLNSLLLTNTAKGLGQKKHEYMIHYIRQYQSEVCKEVEFNTKEIPISPNTEFEIKAHAPAKEVLARLLHSFGKPATLVQKDVYYDNPRRSLFKQGVYVRIRDNRQLQVKYCPEMLDPEHMRCEEIAFDLEGRNISGLAELLGKYLGKESKEKADWIRMINDLSLAPFVVIEKTRQIYKGQGVEISLDKIENLGDFIEIEVKEKSRIDYFRSWAADHGLVHIPTGYVELYLRQTDFDTYILGPYILPEDKERVVPIKIADGGL